MNSYPHKFLVRSPPKRTFAYSGAEQEGAGHTVDLGRFSGLFKTKQAGATGSGSRAAHSFEGPLPDSPAPNDVNLGGSATSQQAVLDTAHEIS